MNINLFYAIKPFLPRRMQINIRRIIAKRKRLKHLNSWPIDFDAGKIPDGWKGWPDKRRIALVLSHDVDTQKGYDHIMDVLEAEKNMGFRSAFNLVPERYRISKSLIETIKSEGFEVNIHGLKHDGKLFKSRTIFDQRAILINRYIAEWGINGFTAPSMICNINWLHDLKINHSTCSFDTDPFEPQPQPSKTIFPILVKNNATGNVFVELPYTLPQDHSLFIILREKDISIWRKKLDWIAEKGGMALLNTHPDYMHFGDGKMLLEEYPKDLYIDFLRYIKTKYEGQFWHALPEEVAGFIRSQNAHGQ